MGEFTDKALAAYEEYESQVQAGDVERIKKQTETTKMLFVKKFGFEPEHVDAMMVTIDGLKFLRVENRMDYSSSWHLYGKCPKCGEECLSMTVYSIESVGYMLNDFDPSMAHECPSKKQEKPQKSPDEMDIIIDKAIMKIALALGSLAEKQGD